MYKWKDLWIVFIVIFLAGCSTIEADQGIVIEEKSELSKQVEIASSSSTPFSTQKPIDIPMRYLSKKEEVNPFANTIFAIDPLENQPPRFGVIYANLPDDTLVRIWLRYYDQSKVMQGDIQYQPVKKGIVRYLFEISPSTPEQIMLLEVSMRLDDEEYPQPQGVIDLLGPHGEYLKGDQVVEREWGGKYVHAEWSLDWPNAKDDQKRVYISQTGAKYHKKSCRHYRSSMEAVLPEIAQMQGYDACSVCGG